jgi:hypothetical protein
MAGNNNKNTRYFYLSLISVGGFIQVIPTGNPNLENDIISKRDCCKPKKTPENNNPDSTGRVLVIY